MPVLNLDLHQKQGLAFTSEATEILYGGAAGGGKSHLLRVVAIVLAISIPGIQIYLFRRQYSDLISNHMDGPSGFPAMLADLIATRQVKITGENSKPDIDFPKGGTIHLRHCQHEKDVRNYQGAEIHVLLIDELTHFLESMYRFLRGRVRLGGLNIPEQYRDVLPRIICGANPGGVGHQWVKRTFIDMLKAYEPKQMPKEEGGLLRQYIPALLEDNPPITEHDPDYEMRLEGLGNPDLVKAMRYGLWDITAGAALEKLSRDKHMIRRFKVPQYWTKFTVIDWGTAKPFAVGWFCVADEDLELVAKEHWTARLIPKNSIIMYRELYGWNGKPDEGCRWESFEVAKKILAIEEETGEHIDYRVGDSAMWAEHDGPSIAERMQKATKNRYIMQPSKKDREANYQEFRARLVGENGFPTFYTTEDCQHFWRTVPDLQLDETHPERGWNTTQEDHLADVCGYSLASRPPVTKLIDREHREYEKAMRRANKQKPKPRYM
jgi:hypothetical protein